MSGFSTTNALNPGLSCHEKRTLMIFWSESREMHSSGCYKISLGRGAFHRVLSTRFSTNYSGLNQKNEGSLMCRQVRKKNVYDGSVFTLTDLLRSPGFQNSRLVLIEN
jgi:hypothetical protein